MSTNLNQEYLAHDHIRRRMRWFFLLVVVLGASLFFAYSAKDDATLKEFMRPPFNAPVTDELPPSNATDEKRGLEQQLHIAILLWDEKQIKVTKGNDSDNHHLEPDNQS
ncbi:MAG: hypothetical protein ABIR48_06020 [Gammaproteobacteria bacterium]